MSILKRTLASYLKGVALLFDFTGSFFPKHQPLPPRPAPGDSLSGDYLAICGDMQRAFTRLERRYQKADS